VRTQCTPTKSFGGLRIGAVLTDTGIDNPIVHAWLQYRFPF